MRFMLKYSHKIPKGGFMMYKILVVDDEPKIREVIKEYAEFSGYEVTEAEDGMSAVGLGSSTLVQPKTKFFNLATHWKMGFFYEIFCQI